MQTVQATNPAAAAKASSMRCAEALFQKKSKASQSKIVVQDSESGYAVIETPDGELKVLAIRPDSLRAYFRNETWHGNTMGMERSERYRYQAQVANQREDFEYSYEINDECAMGENVRYQVGRSSAAELLNDLFQKHGSLTGKQLLLGVSGPYGSEVAIDVDDFDCAREEIFDALVDAGVINDGDSVPCLDNLDPLRDFHLSGNSLFLNDDLV